MSTYGEMQDRIADELDDSDLRTGGQIAKAIQTAIQKYERKRFYFNSAIHTFSTVANREYYGASDLAQIPSLVTIDWMYATVNGTRLRIWPVTDDKLVDAQSGQTLGAPPQYFSYAQQQIRLYGIPSDVWPITMADIYRLTALALDADENAWTDDGEELIRQAAKRILMSEVTHELPPGSGPTPAEMMALDDLRKETRLRIGQTQMRADDLVAMQGRGRRYDVYSDTPR